MRRIQGMALAILCAVCGCDEDDAASEHAPRSSEAAAGASPAQGEAVSQEKYFNYRTTDSQVALRNLDAQIVAQERATQGPRWVEAHARLVDLLLLRASLRGRFDDLSRAAELSHAALEKAPQEPTVLLARARALSATHDFDAAEKLVQAHAEKLGEEGHALLRTLRVAQGQSVSPELVRVAAQAAQQRPSLSTFSHHALMLASTGQFEAAAQQYRQALDTHRDVSPFPVVQVLFQWAMMWAEEANQPERARPLYEAAVRRLPQFVRAQVHLAEIELEAGDEASAVQRLRAVAPRTQDPEPSGFLGEILLRRRPNDAGARSLVKKASERYEELLKRMPKAFADHAAEFYLGPGKQPERAWELAQLNFRLRPTERALSLLASAARASGGSERLCSEVPLEELRGLPRWRLDEAVRQALSSCP